MSVSVIPTPTEENRGKFITILLADIKENGSAYDNLLTLWKTFEKNGKDVKLFLQALKGTKSGDRVLFVYQLAHISDYDIMDCVAVLQFRDLDAFITARSTEHDTRYREQLIASAARKRLFELYPWLVLRTMIHAKSLAVTYGSALTANDDCRKNVLQFFDNQSDFNIREVTVLKAAKAPNAFEKISNSHRDGVVDFLSRLQRTQAFAADYSMLPFLMAKGFTSALIVALIPLNEFYQAGKLSDHKNPVIKITHENATRILHRNEAALTSLHRAVRGDGVAALDGISTEKDRLLMIGKLGGDRFKNINLEELFGVMVNDPCEDCNSVTSPAAYFVELLQFLRSNNLDQSNSKITGMIGPSGTTGTLLQKLFDRRPDLGELQLSCSNTNTLLPYLDLANEVMESFVAHLDKHEFNSPDATTGVVTVKTNIGVHNSDTGTHAMPEPEHKNADAYSLLSRAVYPFSKLPYNQALDEVRIYLKYLGTSRYELLETYRVSRKMDRSLIAEHLGLTHDEYSALTGEVCQPGGPMIQDECKYWGYANVKDLLEGLQFIKSQFLPRSAIRFSDLVDLLKTTFINPIAVILSRKPIVIFHKSEKGDQYRLVHFNGEELTASDYRRMRQFVHLWRRLGWTMYETDQAIAGLSEPQTSPEISPLLLEKLVIVQKLVCLTDLEPTMVLTFWSPISMQGENSLYSRLFLTPGILAIDPTFKLDDGNRIAPPKISQHQTLVMASLSLTKEGLDDMTKAIGSDELSLANLSILYRHALMAKFLDVTPGVLLQSFAVLGDPFTSPASCLHFVELWKRMEGAGFTFAQLNFVLHGVDDPLNPLYLSEQDLLTVVASLSNGLAAYPNIVVTERERQENDVLRQQLETDLFITAISGVLQLSREITRVLLSLIVVERKTALEVLRSTIKLQEDKVLQHCRPTVALLSRVAVFITGFNLSPKEVICVLGNEAGFQGFADSKLSLMGWKGLLSYYELRGSLQKGVNESLLDLLIAAHSRTSTGTAALSSSPLSPASKLALKRIGDLFLVKGGTIEKMVTDFGSTVESFENVPGLTKLKKAYDLATRLFVDVNSLSQWANSGTGFMQTHQIAEGIRGSIKGRFAVEDWKKIVKPLQDQLRQNQREALIAHLLVQPKLVEWGVVDADSLFQFFLIDVQMGPCLETSRIKQAISTIQVFVQRCFCGLEERYGVSNNELDQKRWEWMQNYRVWEANRKIFLHPENWVDPSLRDDKSPFFKEFEADLLKKELDSQSIQDAIKSYISRVDEVANLHPVALCVENTKSVAHFVHIFARTRGLPSVYYYRAYNVLRKQWRPWEKMEIEIQYYEDPLAIGYGGAFLIPVTLKGRLIIFTPQFIKKTKQADNGKAVKKDEMLTTTEAWEIKLGWCEYRNGKWTKKQLSAEAAKFAVVNGSNSKQRWEVRDFIFTTAQSKSNSDVRIIISCRKPDGAGEDVGSFEFSKGHIRLRGTGVDMALAGWPARQFNAELDTGALVVNSTQLTEIASLIRHLQYPKPVIRGSPATIQFSDKEDSVPFHYELFSELLTYTTPTSSLSEIYHYLQTIQLGPAAPSYNELATPYGLYDWELGLHAPMLLMDKLTSTHQYDKALEVARYVFDPLARGSRDSGRVWKWSPFKEVSTARTIKSIISGLGPEDPSQLAKDAGSLATNLSSRVANQVAPRINPPVFDEGKVDSNGGNRDVDEILGDLRPNTSDPLIDTWRDNPFQPHLIARDRPLTYMKWMVVRYIKILINAGDQMFRQETLESMPLAIQYYTMAAHLYGPPRMEIPKHETKAPQTFNSLVNQWDAFSNAMVDFETAFPFTIDTRAAPAAGQVPHIRFGYFCVPNNPMLNDLRNLLDDRLYKIRNGQDINGNYRSLALFEPAIDPGALVRAVAGGLSLANVLQAGNVPMPNYRFRFLLEKAFDMVQELKSLGDGFLEAKEKKDSQAYELIRARHETTINTLVMDIKKLSRDEANKAIETLRQSRNGPLSRLKHYLKLIGEDSEAVSLEKFKPVEYSIEKPTGSLKINQTEYDEKYWAEAAANTQASAKCSDSASAGILVFPTPALVTTPMGVGVSAKVGPKQVAQGFRSASLALEATAVLLQRDSDSIAKTNAFTRQYHERALEANSAGHELQAINAQIQEQQVRITIAETEIYHQEKQIEMAQATEVVLRSKYTNQELYSWQETQLRTLFYQTYTLAYDLAKKVEKTYEFERGLTGTNFIHSSWDSNKDGLFSAENLSLGLRRLETAYQESHGYDYEITKDISLRQINPIALLELRNGEICKFKLNETLFDLDFPGHIKRRIKSVSLSLSCVTGPYTNTNCTLDLVNHQYRLQHGEAASDMHQDRIPISSVALSHGQQDSGVFELNFEGERYLPFEGAGAISSWNLSLPTFCAFDYRTIKDVIVHLRYTSVASQGNAATTTTRVNKLLSTGTGEGAMFALFDLRNDFETTWAQLGLERPMVLSNLASSLPWWTQQRQSVDVVEVQLLTSVSGEFNTTTSTGAQTPVFTIKEGGRQTVSAPEGSKVAGMRSFKFPVGIKKLEAWELTMHKQQFILPDLWMLVQYKVDTKMKVKG